MHCICTANRDAYMQVCHLGAARMPSALATAQSIIKAHAHPPAAAPPHFAGSGAAQPCPMPACPQLTSISSSTAPSAVSMAAAERSSAWSRDASAWDILSSRSATCEHAGSELEPAGPLAR